MKKVLMPAFLLIVLSSCSNYYKAITASAPKETAGFSDFRDTQKYYILRNGSQAFAMKNISLSSNHENLQCTLEELPLEHQLYANNGKKPKMKYAKPTSKDYDETKVLNEVHIYVAPGIITEMGAFTLAMANVQKAEIIEQDKVKTKKSHTTGTVITIVSSVVGVGIIVLAAAASSLKFL